MAIIITWFQSSLIFWTTVTEAKGVYTHTTNNIFLFGSIIWLLHKAQPSILMPRDAGHAPFSGKMMVFKLQRLKKAQCHTSVASSTTLEVRASWSFLALGGHDDIGVCLKLRQDFTSGPNWFLCKLSCFFNFRRLAYHIKSPILTQFLR